MIGERSMLVVVPGTECVRHTALIDRAFRFRHAIFVEEKGWEEIRRPDGREHDRFDCKDTIHHICFCGDEIAGYQRLLPTTRPHILSDVLAHLCRDSPPRGPNIYEWTRFCIAPRHRRMRPCGDGPFLELAQAVVEWGMVHGIHTVTAVIDWRLMVIAMRLHFFARPLGFPQRIGHDEVIALQMSFDHETLRAIHQARGSSDMVLPDVRRPSAA
jgi:acyl-homoserine lactone synthase